MKDNTLILIAGAGVALYLFTKKNGNGVAATNGSGAQPVPTAANLSGGTSRSDGTAAVRGDYSPGTGYRTFPPPTGDPILIGGNVGGGSGNPIMPTSYPTASAAKVMGPSDVEKFFDGLTTRGFGDVFGGEVRHPLLDGKTPCQAIDAMNAYAAARYPEHPEWRWNTNDIPTPFNLWVC